MLLLVSAIIPRFIAVTACDLHVILPCRCAIDRQAITDINTDMARKPDCFSRYDPTEIIRFVIALVEHLGIVDIRYLIAAIYRSAIGSVLITVPSPQDALDEADPWKCLISNKVL